MSSHLLVDSVQAVLARHGGGWHVVTDPPWCRVQPGQARTDRIQGWKLHVSATPLSAPHVLAVAAEILVRRGCAFKFADTVDRVGELCSRHVDRGGGGKFLTAYPSGDEDAVCALADELHQATLGLPGPGILSDRPYRPGSLVHYRYGAFGGVPVLGNDGVYEAMLVTPDGSLGPDQRKAWFSPPAWAPPAPFARRTAPALGAAPVDGRRTARPVLLNGRYLVQEVIRHGFPGGVFRAVDKQSGAPVIVKQARPHADADLTGQDVRDGRRHEGALLSRFQESGRTARLVEIFEQQGDVFLVQEDVGGVDLRHWVAARVGLPGPDGWGPPLSDVLRLSAELVELVAMVHAEGLVLRDFNPNNVMVADDGRLRLIDLEMLSRPGQCVRRCFTTGYGAPEQVAAAYIGPAPDPSADLYSLGMTLFYLATGVDPLLAPDDPPGRTDRERIQRWLARLVAGNSAARRLAGPILALAHEDPARRPGLDEVRGWLTGAAARGPVATGDGDGVPDEVDPARAVDDAVGYLIGAMRPDDPARLWPSGAFGATTDPHNVQHGAAGILGVLVRAWRAAPDPALRGAVATAAGWIARRVRREPRILPGLYFGRSGTAWALLDAAAALGDDDLAEVAIDLARRVPVRWPNPDVCHGVAGAGLTQIRFWEHTGHEEFLDRVRLAADTLAHAVRYRDGLARWPVPADFASSLAGAVQYGFAHGVAGVGAFLLGAARVTGEPRYAALASAAADTLVAVALREGDAAYWTSDERGGPPRTNWCSGSSGAGTFLLRAWRHTGDDRYGELAVRAAVTVRRTRWSAGTTQCHGLAGEAEFLLDLADTAATGAGVLGDPARYRDWARELLDGIYARDVLRDGRLLVADESGAEVTADFNTGLAGVLALLLRMRDGAARMWLPAALTRPEASPQTRPAPSAGAAAETTTAEGGETNGDGAGHRGLATA